MLERLCSRGVKHADVFGFHRSIPLTFSHSLTTPRSDLRLDEDEVDALPRVGAHQAHRGAGTEGLGEDGAGVRPVRDARAHGARLLRVHLPPVRREPALASPAPARAGGGKVGLTAEVEVDHDGRLALEHPHGLSHGCLS